MLVFLAVIVAVTINTHKEEQEKKPKVEPPNKEHMFKRKQYVRKMIENNKDCCNTKFSYFFYLNRIEYVCAFYVVLEDLNNTGSLTYQTSISVYVFSDVYVDVEKVRK